MFREVADEVDGWIFDAEPVPAVQAGDTWLLRDCALSSAAAPAAPFVEAAHRNYEAVNGRLKRGFDVSVSACLILLLLPLMTCIALLICMELRCNPLFRQRRTGLHGRCFDIYKFRTMYVAENGRAVMAATANDARITKLGSFLRRTSIDELPQLINVLRGDMSLVGPRPHAEIHDEIFGLQIPEYRLRFATRPGLTGLAQVSGFRGEIRSIGDLRSRLRCDLHYIREWSLRTDLLILARTFVTH